MNYKFRQKELQDMFYDNSNIAYGLVQPATENRQPVSRGQLVGILGLTLGLGLSLSGCGIKAQTAEARPAATPTATSPNAAASAQPVAEAPVAPVLPVAPTTAAAPKVVSPQLGSSGPETQTAVDSLRFIKCLSGIFAGTIDQPIIVGLKKFQSNVGEIADGIDGPRTAARLAAAVKAGNVTCGAITATVAQGVPYTIPNKLDRNLLNPDGSYPAPYGPISTTAPNQPLVCDNLPPGMRLECNSQLPPKP